MAYDEFFADRIRQTLKEKKVSFEEKKMMGGICYLVNDKMLCGIHFDKKKQTDLLMARVGERASDQAMERTGCLPMDFTGRPMKGFVFVTPEGFDSDEDLEYWIQLCLDFNPMASSSKKKK
jgi:hypothetical protein